MGETRAPAVLEEDIGLAERMFWENGYIAVDRVSDMDHRGRDLLSAHVERNGRSDLLDLSIAQKTCAWFAPARLRGGFRPTL